PGERHLAQGPGASADGDDRISVRDEAVARVVETCREDDVDPWVRLRRVEMRKHADRVALLVAGGRMGTLARGLHDAAEPPRQKPKAGGDGRLARIEGGDVRGPVRQCAGVTDDGEDGAPHRVSSAHASWSTHMGSSCAICRRIPRCCGTPGTTEVSPNPRPKP